jgi:hypothetical protein
VVNFLTPTFGKFYHARGQVIQKVNTNLKISLTRGILISSIRESYIDKELINFLKTVSFDVEDNAHSTGKSKLRRRRTANENKGS